MKIRMLLEYDGTDFHGWQVQPDQPTVQQTLEEAFFKITGERVDVVGSGRTDAGVHARGQVAHAVLGRPVDPFRLQASLNGVLPKTVSVKRVEETVPSFHARYDARQRAYSYYVGHTPSALDRHHRILVRPIPDYNRMNEAARHLIGEHHFDAFCRVKSETKNRICTVFDAGWVEEHSDEKWHFHIEANRFLHGMVRAIVGTLLQIGQGKRQPGDVVSIIASRDRTLAGPAAPARGLILERVMYEPDFTL